MISLTTLCVGGRGVCRQESCQLADTLSIVVSHDKPSGICYIVPIEGKGDPAIGRTGQIFTPGLVLYKSIKDAVT